MFDTSPLSLSMEAALRRLAPERREKAARLRREEARRQSVGAGLLLAHFFPGRRPQSGPGGKPYIPGERCFSLSHSGAMIVIALGDVPVGVDIERAAPVPEALRRRVLSPSEAKGMIYLQWPCRIPSWASCWASSCAIGKPKAGP